MSDAADVASRTFINLDHIKRDGSKRRFWDLLTMQSPMSFNGKSYLSLSTFQEIDCAKDESSTLKVLGYSEPDGRGTIVYDNTTAIPQIEPIVPDSVAAKEERIVCK